MNVTLRISENGSGRNSHNGHLSQVDAEALYLLAKRQPVKNGIAVRKSDAAETNWHWEVPIRLGAYTQTPLHKPAHHGDHLPVLFREQPGFVVGINI